MLAWSTPPGRSPRRGSVPGRPDWFLVGPRQLRTPAARRLSDVGQRRAELPAGTNSELSEYFAQMPLHSAGAQKELSGDLRVRLPAGGEARDLRLLRGQLVECRDGPLAHRLAGGQELAVGALGECLHAHVREHCVRDPQLLAGIDTTVLAPQP